MMNRQTFWLVVRVIALLLVIGMERSAGLPIWFVFGTLSLIRAYEWRTRLGLLGVLSLALSLGYVIPFAVGFGVLWGAGWAEEQLESRLKSQTLRLTIVTILVVAIMSGLKHFAWDASLVGWHLLSLLGLVTAYRAYVGYQLLAPQRWRVSQRLRL